MSTSPGWPSAAMARNPLPAPARLPHWNQDAVGARPHWLGALDPLGGEGLPRARWLRRFRYALLVLVAVDLVVRLLVPAPDYEARFTMPYNGLTHLRSFVAHVRAAHAAGRRTIVFLGDSSARSRIPSGSPTLAELYARAVADDPALKASPPAVYNFSVAGLDPASKYLIARALGDGADVVLFNINLRGFASDPRRAVPYPELWFELKPELSAADRAHLLSAPSAGELSPAGLIENRLEDALGKVWALFGRRIELKDLLLRHAHPRQWLARAPTPWEGPLAGFPPDLRNRWLDTYTDACQGDAPRSDSADLYFLSRLYALTRATHAVFLGYTAPYSRGLNAAEWFIDDALVAADVAALKGIPRDPARTLLLDYNDPARGFDPAPGDRFSQAFEHWTADGLRLLAARLHRDTRALVLGAVR